MVIMHSCDNPKCVNPAHLSQATNSDNIKDMHRKDRCPNNWKRATCKRGHVFDEVNTYLFRGKQCCRACRAATNKRLRLEKLAAR